MHSQRRNEKSDIIFKIILIGESGTGKSCLMNRYVKQQFTSLYQTTIGTEFQSKTISIDGNYTVKLQIWDTAGQESFRSIIKSFFRKTGAVLLVYNIVNRESFDALSEWKALAKESAPQNALFIIVGTHLDLEHEREISRDEVNEWMIANNVDISFQTSAKNDLNVTSLFEQIGKRLFCREIEKRKVNQKQNEIEMMKLKQETTNSTKNCC